MRPQLEHELILSLFLFCLCCSAFLLHILLYATIIYIQQLFYIPFAPQNIVFSVYNVVVLPFFTTHEQAACTHMPGNVLFEIDTDVYFVIIMVHKNVSNLAI